MRLRLTHLWHFLRRPPLPFKIASLIIAAIAYGAAGFVYFERPGKPGLGWLDGFWWAVVSMTTVGYGDYFPATNAGRFVVAYPIMLIGMGFMAYGLAQFAGFLVHADTLNRKGLMMTSVRDHILVCNFPSAERFGELLGELRSQPELRRKPVVLIDEHLEELPRELAHDNVHFVRGHPTQSNDLHRAGCEGATCAVVLARDPADLRSDNATAAIALSLKAANPDLRIAGECLDPSQQEVLRRAGCCSVVCVMGLAAGMLAQELCDPGVVRVLAELTAWRDDINNVFIVPVELVTGPYTVADLRTWADANHSTILGVQTDVGVELNPHGARPLSAGESAIVIAQTRPQRIHL